MLVSHYQVVAGTFDCNDIGMRDPCFDLVGLPIRYNFIVSAL